MALQVRALTAEELATITRLAQSRTAAARAVERARIILAAHQGARAPAIAARLGRHEKTARLWVKRFNADGVAGLADAPRAGRPATSTPEEVGAVVAAALTDPQTLALPFGCWTYDQLAAYLNEVVGLPIKRSRINAVRLAEGRRWRQQERWFGARGSGLRAQKGAIEQLSTAPPVASIVVCVDEMGPARAKSFAGRRLVRAAEAEQPAARARQAIDDGRRGGGYVFGAFQPATGAALTAPYERRTTANFVAFLARVEAWLPPEAERVYAILDNLSAHRAPDVLLFSLACPRWAFVFQPVYAAYLNLIEPWWKAPRSLALKGRRFATWAESCAAVERATAYWNAHKHPFVWGRRRRHRPRRKPGLALGANVRPT